MNRFDYVMTSDDRPGLIRSVDGSTSAVIVGGECHQLSANSLKMASPRSRQMVEIAAALVNRLQEFGVQVHHMWESGSEQELRFEEAAVAAHRVTSQELATLRGLERLTPRCGKSTW